MTNSYFNAAAGAAATPAPIFSSHDSTVDAQSAANATPRAPIAPWVQGGFVAIPIEFSRLAIGQLSPRAQSLYIAHCSHANARGENAGFSYCYRETLARELNCSLDTIDRANLELEKHGMIEDNGRRYRHGGAVVYQLNAPAKWKFEAPPSPVKSPPRAARKGAALTPQRCAGEAATLRPITRDKEHLKAKEQQTALEEIENVRADSESVEATKPKRVAVVVVENQIPVENPKAPDENEARVRAALVRQSFTAGMAERLMLKHGTEACARQLERLTKQSHVKSATGWLIRALERDDHDAVAAVVVAAPVPPPSAEEKAERAARMKARAERESAAVARVFAGLDWQRQAYIGRCVELEGLSLAQVIKRDEHYALSRCLLAWREVDTT